ncbi:IS3 family transposase [uncultured Pontibacter sp.]|uniref:IS3 family transposase n=1 Tax=uncultured Pontibacter sp. TaxID=453356 RepID=UPI002603687B|nr:IS3 family transposase [uncultured Pontibacter sp.]
MRRVQKRAGGLPLDQPEHEPQGHCWDNAVTESFFKTMKTEMVYHHQFTTRHEARLAVFEYIASFYNRKRRHSALGYLTPCQYEEWLYQQGMAA